MDSASPAPTSDLQLTMSRSGQVAQVRGCLRLSSGQLLKPSFETASLTPPTHATVFRSRGHAQRQRCDASKWLCVLICFIVTGRTRSKCGVEYRTVIRRLDLCTLLYALCTLRK